ncbi:MAG: DUF5995 family protein [Saprospiraceae bacterium]|jgi:hypothetical protein|nr:DUF5995 family protein [Saprospiraceae bacterium]MDP4811500.1 DUF5995 family protein [Saprospiraceae bacterium]MDP4914872.1 DUF5995 family protein [Saprospiraceae bacterium]
MDTFSFSSENLRDIQSLILHFDRVKVQLLKNKQPNLIPFHDTYFLITTSVFSKLGTGFFENDDNMSTFVLSFAKFYFDALDHNFKGESVSSAWQFMFNQCDRNNLPRFVYLLLGVHAHINQDLSLCVRTLDFGVAFKNDYLAINHIIKGKLAEAIAQLNEKSIVLKRILQNGLFLYQMPMHQIIVLCRNLAWDKSQEVVTVDLAYA